MWSLGARSVGGRSEWIAAAIAPLLFAARTEVLLVAINRFAATFLRPLGKHEFEALDEREDKRRTERPTNHAHALVSTAATPRRANRNDHRHERQ